MHGVGVAGGGEDDGGGHDAGVHDASDAGDDRGADCGGVPADTLADVTAGDQHQQVGANAADVVGGR